MDVSITLSAEQQRYVDAEVARLQGMGETELTASAYLGRRLQKLICTEVDRLRVERRTANVATLEQVVEALDGDPEAETKLAAIGLTIDERGRLHPAENSD
jgi:hypothetical protein